MDISALLHDRAVALCDCNNFFVSCERVANPALKDLPVVVLSSNDGCVVSRSNEAKQLKIPMGAPYFKYRAFFQAHNVRVCSGNMPLYKDISASVMSVLSRFTDELDQYSIDEAFLNLAILAVTDPVAYCANIRSEVLKQCGIPISIGISPNKTLSKLASEYSKKHPDTGGVFWFDRAHYEDKEFMAQFTVRDVWGIGRQNEKKLSMAGINNVAQLTQLDPKIAKERFGLPMLVTVWALQGKAAEHKTKSKSDPQKSIQVSRSFGTRITDYDTLLDALQNFTVAAARQLRAANAGAKLFRIYLRSGGFNERQYYSDEVKFNTPEYLDGVLLAAARQMLDKIFRPGLSYTKAGVDIPFVCSRAECEQQLLFQDTDVRQKQTKAEEAADNINKALGISAIKPAGLYTVEGTIQNWRPKTEHSAKEPKKLQDTRGMKFASHAEEV